MQSKEIRKKFLEFFKERGHAIVPSSSLIPDDPSVLLTTAGMQQFKKYYTGELDAMKDFGSRNAASIQKSFRTSDIDEVGDDTHLTFFEMLGNFSFGGYFKQEAIKYAHEFITEEMGLKISCVTIFKGNKQAGVPKDEESKEIWNSLDHSIEVREEGMEDIFWGPTGSSGPCGPTTEIYCKNANGKDVEIWNIVFNEFFCSGSREKLLTGEAKLAPLKTKGIDTGMGFERLVMISQSKKSIFETDLFTSLVGGRSDTPIDEADSLSSEWRVMLDHSRAIAFLIADGVRPSNKDAGYVLRRLMRRIIVRESSSQGRIYRAEDVIQKVIDYYGDFYKELLAEKHNIEEVFAEESKKFERTVNNGLRELGKLPVVDAATAFKLYESYGLPYEVIKDLGGEKVKGLKREEFDEEFKKHQEKSHAGAEKKFGGHGLILDTGELKAGNEEDMKKVLRLHTATHLLQAALREVLGNEVHQMGSDITPERTRFDFSFSRKMTPEEIKTTEIIVNEKIKEDIPVQFKEMAKAEAEKIGALHFFKEKYPDPVKVYYVGRDISSAWSKEFCGGPHVSRTGEVGEIKIIKEEAVSAGVRRMRAVVVE